MAFAQTLISSRNLFVTVPKNPHTNTKIHTFSPSAAPQDSSFFFPKRPRSFQPLKCSVDYSDQNYNLQVSYPKPQEIPWSKELCNTVHLIGNVGFPVEIKHLPSGKVVARTRLAVKKSSTDTTWINLTFWDEMALTAYQHVEKGQQIYVCGRLVSDQFDGDDGKQQTYYKVVVKQINFVERSSSSVASYDRGLSGMSSKSYRKFGNNGGNNMGSPQELWQAFFANPSEWWDNRKTKRSPKYPDFKHKDTGEALWIEGRNNPHWVKSQLEILDERMSSLQGEDERMAADSFLPF
ncbi:Primosome PriB/single-strand DNA-binding protein [Corchorus capsularis]|uniref:Primosome PriB/single-strand DNA-binding protein n=1 Tax=Corchorus capsularis TaxID=210143 RepID=A0A1R3I772_COCAP|nr:Primosome PriB/single-strand DNA-binding protein [Corchorus capsularis]